MRGHKKSFILLLVIIAFLIFGVWQLSRLLNIGNTETATVEKGGDMTKTFNKTQYSLSDPSSIWVVVNKRRPLPADYIPTGLRLPDVPLAKSGDEMLLRDDAAKALESMVANAAKEDVSLVQVSAYRSYALQELVYNGFVNQDGEAAANRYSAKPGHSEHQTGLATDVGAADGVCQLETCFGETAAGKWVAANAHKYGFTIRYKQGDEQTVGYTYEPWHLRYVGTALASELHRTNQSMEAFFSLPAAPSY